MHSVHGEMAGDGRLVGRTRTKKVRLSSVVCPAASLTCMHTGRWAGDGREMAGDVERGLPGGVAREYDE